MKFDYAKSYIESGAAAMDLAAPDMEALHKQVVSTIKAVSKLSGMLGKLDPESVEAVLTKSTSMALAGEDLRRLPAQVKSKGATILALCGVLYSRLNVLGDVTSGKF